MEHTENIRNWVENRQWGHGHTIRRIDLHRQYQWVHGNVSRHVFNTALTSTPFTSVEITEVKQGSHVCFVVNLTRKGELRYWIAARDLDDCIAANNWPMLSDFVENADSPWSGGPAEGELGYWEGIWTSFIASINAEVGQPADEHIERAWEDSAGIL